MARIHTRSGQGTGSAHSESNHVNQSPLRFGSWWDYFLVRMIFGAACVVAGYYFRPFGLNSWSAATLGGAFAQWCSCLRCACSE